MGPKRARTRPAAHTTVDPHPAPAGSRTTAATSMFDERNEGEDDDEDILKAIREAESRVNLDENKTLEDEDEGDPIIQEYDVFLNDSLTEKLMLLQYPTREKVENKRAKPSELPTEVRWKPRAGMVEVDIPMEVFHSWDREKAVRWGAALRTSTEARAGGSLGLAGGFGVGPSRMGGSRASKKDDDDDNSALGKQSGMLLANFVSANSLGRVLNKQTLGGQINPVEDEKPVYMIGAFERDQLHLTPVDSIAQLRPQFHHLDAEQEQFRSSQRAQREAGNPPRQQETRAIHMTVKSADGEDIDITGATNTLKAAQEENWTHLQYIDPESNEAWDLFPKLFLKETVDAPKLESGMKREEFLDAISASKVETRRPTKKSGGGKGTREDNGPDKAKSASLKVS
ncbi:MAG: hypothetical protein M1816_004161 [Peltula sp. TS41687]|nr:MAG: hypothetical protein M1816_004161 [Peltula sp. TS41687]